MHLEGDVGLGTIGSDCNDAAGRGLHNVVDAGEAEKYIWGLLGMERESRGLGSVREGEAWDDTDLGAYVLAGHTQRGWQCLRPCLLSRRLCRHRSGFFKRFIRCLEVA